MKHFFFFFFNNKHQYLTNFAKNVLRRVFLTHRVKPGFSVTLFYLANSDILLAFLSNITT